MVSFPHNERLNFIIRSQPAESGGRELFKEKTITLVFKFWLPAWTRIQAKLSQQAVMQFRALQSFILMVVDDRRALMLTSAFNLYQSFRSLISKKDWIEQPIVSLWSHRNFAAAILVRPPLCETSVRRSVKTAFLGREEIVYLARMTWNLATKVCLFFISVFLA